MLFAVCLSVSMAVRLKITDTKLNLFRFFLGCEIGIVSQSSVFTYGVRLPPCSISNFRSPHVWGSLMFSYRRVISWFDIDYTFLSGGGGVGLGVSAPTSFTCIT